MTVAAEMSPIGEAADQKIKVAVRVRPLNKRGTSLSLYYAFLMNRTQLRAKQTTVQHAILHCKYVIN